MARVLGSKKNSFIVKDGMTGEDVTLFYRSPSTSELQEFYTDQIGKDESGAVRQMATARVAFAMKILTGLKDGDFSVAEKAAEEEMSVPLSSDPKNPNFREDWKDIIGEHAADLLDTFIFVVFEAPKMTVGVAAMVGEKKPEVAKKPPLESAKS